jgi:hypothetical protein
MTTEYLEKQLAIWKQWLLVSTGASVTLLATAIADFPNRPNPFFPGWFGLGFLLLLNTVTPGIVLLLGSAWRKLPIGARLNAIFGYFAMAWVTLIAFWSKAASLFGISIPLLLAFLGGIGIALGIVYLMLRRGHFNKPEAMFP